MNNDNRVFAVSNDTYDFWNTFITLGLPGLGAFYSAIAAIWKLGYAAEVVGTITALVVLGKILLMISSKAYRDSGAGTVGTIVIDTVNPDKEVISLNLNASNVLGALSGKKEVTFKVDESVSNMDPRLLDNSQ